MSTNYRYRNCLNVFFLFAVLIGLLVVGRVFAVQDPELGTGPTALETAYYIYFPIINVPEPEPIPGDQYDMATYMIGDGRLYEVQTFGGGQTRFQTQTEDTRFFHAKSETLGEWEELWATDEFIYRGTDTSPGHDIYYTLRDPGIYGSAWSPRYWGVGDTFERNPLVTFYEKSDCSIVEEIYPNPGFQPSFLRFEAYYDQFQFASGITLSNVVELAWLLNLDADPIEKYYYAEDYGLVGWWSNDRSFSYISEVHTPGSRPDIEREEISCLDTGASVNWRLAKLLYGQLDPQYRVK